MAREMALVALEGLAPLVQGSGGSQVLVFTEPETFDLVPLAVWWGFGVAVEVDDDGPEAERLRKLLAQMRPRDSLGPYAIGTKATGVFLLEYEEPIRVRDREDALRRLGLDPWDLPSLVKEALEITRDYLSLFVSA